MVRDRITDGYRVAELLASEVDGRRSGPLARLAVANADRSVTGTPEGERAYEVRFLEGSDLEAGRDPRREPAAEDAGRLVARVLVHEAGASVVVVAGADAAADAAQEGGLTVERADDSVASGVDASSSAGGAAPATLRLEYGAQVKRAADALAAASATTDSERDVGHERDVDPEPDEA